MSIVLTIESLRKNLLSDDRKILADNSVRGSEKIQSKLRRVSDIARYSSVPKKYGSLLANMAGEFGSTGIIELGTSGGINTMYMALGNPEAQIITIEESSDISAVAKSNFEKYGIPNITSVTGTLENILPDLLEDFREPGMVFIDPDYSRAPVIDNFYSIAEVSGDSTVVIINNINDSSEMADAWTEIKKHSKVTVSIDICRMGMIFFRKGMTRQDFIIRY